LAESGAQTGEARREEVVPGPAPNDGERVVFGGMARWGGVDFFGPTYASMAQRRGGEIYVWIDPVNTWKPEGTLGRLVRLPILRSVFFWLRLLLQVAGSVRALLFFVGSIAVLWLAVALLENGAESVGGPLGVVLEFLALFPILPVLLLFFAGMKLTPIGRYHGAEHKAVAAYEKYGEANLENARGMSRLHPRCGTNLLLYITVAALLDPLISWGPYAVLQFILVSEAWFIFGATRPSIAIGMLLQRHLTTSEPTRRELEVAVGSLNELLRAENGERGADKEPLLIPARF
jgi:uncharacterized protein YqhQ